MRILRLDVPQCSVGEGPVWDVAEQALYWIDILGRTLFRHRPDAGETRQWSVPDIIGGGRETVRRKVRHVPSTDGHGQTGIGNMPRISRGEVSESQLTRIAAYLAKARVQ
jgi:sugar lactone lactonase YvrE